MYLSSSLHWDWDGQLEVASMMWLLLPTPITTQPSLGAAPLLDGVHTQLLLLPTPAFPFPHFHKAVVQAQLLGGKELTWGQAEYWWGVEQNAARALEAASSYLTLAQLLQSEAALALQLGSRGAGRSSNGKSTDPSCTALVAMQRKPHPH